MKYTTKPRLFYFLVIFMFFFVFSLSIHYNFQQKIIHKENLLNLETSLNSGRIHINNNWTAAKEAGICSGSGIYTDPYIIENFDIITYPESCILIENSNNYLIIRNCSVGHAGLYNAGIELVNVTNSQIIDNDCSFNYYGILLENCHNITVLRNKASDNQYFGYTLDTGIYLINTNESIISQNIANYSGDCGIFLFCSSYNILDKNMANNAESGHGICLINSENNLLAENIVNNNGITSFERFGARFDNGISLYGGKNNVVKENIAINNAYSGIRLVNSKFNLIMDNIIKQNYEGILLEYYSDENLVTKNMITKNDQHGIYLIRESNNNLIFKNEILENAICIEEDNCFGNLYWDNGLCLYIGAPFSTIVIYSIIGIVGIPILVLLEIERRKTHKF